MSTARFEPGPLRALEVGGQIRYHCTNKLTSSCATSLLIRTSTFKILPSFYSTS